MVMPFKTYKIGVTNRFAQDYRMRNAVVEIVNLRGAIEDQQGIIGNLQRQNSEQGAALSILHDNVQAFSERATKAERKARRRGAALPLGIAIGLVAGAMLAK